MNRLIAASILVALAAAPAIGQQTAQDQKGQTRSQQAGKQHAQQMPTRLPVESASSIVGRMARDNAGMPAGNVEYLLISTATGQVENVVIGSGGLLDFGDQDLTAVPWRQVADVPAEGDVLRLNVSKSQLNQAPRVTQDTISDLTKPAVITSIVDFYGVPQGQQQTSQGQQQAAQAQQQAAQGQQSAQKGQQQGGGQGKQGQQTTQDAPRVLIGRQVITTLAPPTFAQPSQMRGAMVVAQNGREIGEIDHVMIDTAHGQVAYVLLARGGFLGIGEEWVPVPLAAMQWSPQQETYRVTASAQAFEKTPPLKRDDLPHSVSAAQLNSLYQRFGASPYWQQVAATDQERSQQQAEMPQNGQQQSGQQ